MRSMLVAYFKVLSAISPNKLRETKRTSSKYLVFGRSSNRVDCFC